MVDRVRQRRMRRRIASVLLGVMTIILGAIAVHAWHHRDLSPGLHECTSDTPRDCPETHDESTCAYCHFVQHWLLISTGTTALLILSRVSVVAYRGYHACHIRRIVDRYSLSDPPHPRHALALSDSFGWCGDYPNGSGVYPQASDQPNQ